MSERLTLPCGCVVKEGCPLSRRFALSRCEVGEVLWQRYLSRHLDSMQRRGGQTEEWAALRRYQEHIDA